MVIGASGEPWRIAVVGTGTVGAHAVRAIQLRGDMELVGAKVYTESKVGRDVGELLLGEPLGVLAVADVAGIIAVAPHAVVYAPNRPVHAEIFDLLKAGVNVITTSGAYLFYPFPDAQLTANLEAACSAGGASFHGTGVDPGFMPSRMPLVLSSWCRRIDRVKMSEAAHMVDYPSATTLFDLMHFGQPLDPTNCTKGPVGQRIGAAFESQVAQLVLGLGATLERVEQNYEEAPAPRTLEVAAGTVAKGTVAGQRWRWSGIVDGATLVELEVNWILSDELPGWPTKHGWRVDIDGDPDIHCTLETGGGLNGDDECCIATAMLAVNAIPVVCAARPGVRTVLDLPAVHGRHLSNF